MVRTAPNPQRHLSPMSRLRKCWLQDCKGGLVVKKTNSQLHVWTVAAADGVFAQTTARFRRERFPGQQILLPNMYSSAQSKVRIICTAFT